MDDSEIKAAKHGEFIDFQSIAWGEVRRVETLFYQRFEYEYPGPIRDLTQRLVIVPAKRFGAQHLRDHALIVDPLPAKMRHSTDGFGNRVVELEVPQADRFVSFEVTMVVETEAHDQRRPAVSLADTLRFLEFTRLTTPDHSIRAAARQLSREATEPHDLARRINEWVAANMDYKHGVTSVKTTAADALRIGEGLCQDYSHLMLSLCRTAGLPARYVSGHMLGEGGSHAWVEVFLPTDRGLRAFAFDPTNNRIPHLGYITVAVGRDYSDVSPTSGSFTAPYSGCLTCSKRAGLTMVEFLNGELLRSRPAM